MRLSRSSAFGGLFIGIFSLLPVVNLANFCCCLWVVLGGVLTAYLLQQEKAEPSTPADAALAGAIAGLVGALIYVAGTALLFSIAPVSLEENIRAALARTPELPPEMRDAVLSVASRPGVLFWVIAILYFPVYAVFSLLGGLLGAAMFRTNKATATGD